MPQDPRRQLPAVHRLLDAELVARHGHARVVRAAEAVLAEARADAGERLVSAPVLLERMRVVLASGVRAAINATGVVLHTNLGRAPWSERALAAAVQAAGYSTVELELGGPDGARRGRRGAAAEDRIAALTGAEAALVVNNGAAAVLLCLRALAEGQRVLVSRGELVEIGGGFRVPDILRESGALLCEVGTTNRTHLRDFERALSEPAAAILRVHHSNFRQVGFTAAPDVAALAALGPPVVVDAGSGALREFDDEPVVPRLLAAGAALVCFSGDKLLGGPQAGLVVGRRELVERLRTRPLARALRPDKVTLAALEATLDDWLLGHAVPARAMIETPLAVLRDAACGWLSGLPDGVEAEVVEVEGAVGGGSLPGRTWPSVALAIARPAPLRLRAALLDGEPPVVARIQRDRLLLDARTVVAPGHGALLLERLRAAIASLG